MPKNEGGSITLGRPMKEEGKSACFLGVKSVALDINNSVDVSSSVPAMFVHVCAMAPRTCG